MNHLVKEIREHAIEYGSIPFWSWNDKLEEQELRRQIRNMYDMDMRGFFMHARGGLETEYMSEEWFDCIKACIDEAKKLGMEAWAYDENGWPSGFAGGKVLENPDNHAVFVVESMSETFPEQDGDALATYAIGADGIPRITDRSVDGCRQYLTVLRKTDSSYVDTMRADVTEQFLAATHEEYKRRIREDFGGTMPGFFTDEPQYYRWNTPYSNCMDAWFRGEYGYSVLEALPALFVEYPGAEKHRYDYWRMASKRFTENFSKKLYTWAEENGAQITGHFIEERSLNGQMRCCADIMPQYQYEHIPGMDYLKRDLQTDLAPKQLGSVCAQTGRKKVLSEMFACCGWDVTPRELKHIAELQYAGAVNVMCQHLYPYSIRGQRKRDYPAFYSEHNLWQKDMKPFNRFFNHLGYMLSMGEELADTLVIHPIHSAWLWYRRTLNEKSIEGLEQDLDELTYLLSGNQITYHFGSETMMADIAKVCGTTIAVGLCSYKQVVVPACDTLDSTTVALLKQFKENGGRIYTYKHHLPSRIDGVISDLSFLDGCEDISEPSVFAELKSREEVVVNHIETVEKEDLRMMVRKTEYGRLIYLANLSDKDFRGLRITVKDCHALGKMDIATLQTAALAGRTVEKDAEVLLDLVGSESVILTEYDAPAFAPFVPAEQTACITFTEPFAPTEIPTNLLTLDRAFVSLNGGAFSELRPMERIRDELLSSRFNGEITLAFPFEIRELPTSLEVITEPMGANTITVNGRVVSLGTESALDRSFRVTDIAPYVQLGENRIELSLRYWQSEYVYYVLYGGVSETLRNCLVFDTEIENLYLRGSFALDMKKEHFVAEEHHAYRYDPENGMALIRPKSQIDIRNLVTDGYPFYCGEFTASAKLRYQAGDPTVLHLTGRYATARVQVNGKEAGNVLFSEYVELKDFLREGENTVTVTICNNYRNLMGPHHRAEAEPLGVGPGTFSFEKKWKNGQCEGFDGRYAFVRFGIDV